MGEIVWEGREGHARVWKGGKGWLGFGRVARGGQGLEEWQGGNIQIPARGEYRFCALMNSTAAQQHCA